jgi:hypothetical protein
MGITINISENPTVLPSTNSAAEVMPLDAGACVALAPTGAADPTAHAHARDRALDGGSPPASLVLEIDAALLTAPGATKPDVSSSGDGVSAGAAPV